MALPSVKDVVESSFLFDLPLTSPWFFALILVGLYVPTIIVVDKNPAYLVQAFKKNTFAIFCAVSIIGFPLALKLIFDVLTVDNSAVNKSSSG